MMISSVVRRAAQLGVVQRAMATMAIKMPALSPTMESGQVKSWSVQVGDEVSAGDVLFVVETDKAAMDVESSDDGVVAKILVEANADQVPIGRVVALLVEPGEDPASAVMPAETSGAVAAAAPPAPSSSPAASSQPASLASTTSATATIPSNLFLSPAVRRVVLEHGVDVSAVTATGPGGRLLKSDILAFVSGEATAKPQPKSSAAAAVTPRAPTTTSKATKGRVPPTSRRERTHVDRAIGEGASRPSTAQAGSFDGQMITVSADVPLRFNATLINSVLHPLALNALKAHGVSDTIEVIDMSGSGVREATGVVQQGISAPTLHVGAPTVLAKSVVTTLSLTCDSTDALSVAQCLSDVRDALSGLQSQ